MSAAASGRPTPADHLNLRFKRSDADEQGLATRRA